jgi:hypothetical protein
MEFIARVNVRDSEEIDDRIVKIIDSLKEIREELDGLSNQLLKGIQIKIEDRQV